MEKIPFVDLKIQYQNLKTEIDSAIASVIADTAFIGGSSNKYVNQFEKDFAQYLKVEHVISCANGTDSLEILLEAFQISKNDEVIVPALSWISTSEAVGRAGATPVFVDVCPDTLLMDINLIEEKITAKTRAIIPVHLYGNALDMESIIRLAKKHNLIVIEDCAQSHGAKYNNKLTGTFGHAASFSFYPGKNLGAYGDAGSMVTNDKTIADKCRMIANHGQLKKHHHQMEGRNSRLDGIHAAILSVKLKYLDVWNDKRKDAATKYASILQHAGIQLPVENVNASHVYHLFVIQQENRDELIQKLSNNNIEFAIHYPTPLPLMEAYSTRGFTSNDFPVAAKACNQILSLPMFPEISDLQIKRIAAIICD